MRERINTGRQGELDVAKALAIPYMVIIHVYEELSVVDCGVRPDSLFRGVLEFLGGPLATPVFMFAMGWAWSIPGTAIRGRSHCADCGCC